MKEKIVKIKKIVICRKWILLFLSFFSFFFVVTSYNLGVSIYLESINKEYVWVFILFIEQISIIIMPLLVTRICSKIGNLRFAKWGTLSLALLFSLSFITDSILYVIFFAFPFILRIYNNSLNPYISKTSDQESLISIFALRDFFLYLGVAVGLLFSYFIFSLNYSFVSLIQLFSFMFLISSVFLFLNKNDLKEKNNEVEFSIFSLPLKNVKNKRLFATFLFIFIGFSWTSYVVRYIPLFFVNIGFTISNIYLSYALTYIGTPFLAIIASIMITEKKLKFFFIIDILIDIIPFSLILFSSLNVIVAIIVLLFIQLRDFLSPISTSYFFKSFNEDEKNEVWGVLGSLNALISLFFPFVIGSIFMINNIYLFLITILIIIIISIVALFYLPNIKSNQ